PLGMSYPPGIYSLSHVALPFPVTDALYGMAPDEKESFGPNLGALAPRGERNVLITSLDALLRVASNPFFPYLVERIEEGIDRQASTPATARAAPATPGEDAAVALPPNDSPAPSSWSSDASDLPP